jgi:hypothetical protein
MAKTVRIVGFVAMVASVAYGLWHVGHDRKLKAFPAKPSISDVRGRR